MNTTNEQRTADYLQNFSRERVLKSLIRTNPVIFDVGANVGQSAKEFLEWWPDAEIHCFEPQKECWESLESLPVKVNRYALGDKHCGAVPFYSHEMSSGISGFHKFNLESKDSINLQNPPEGYEDLLNRERRVGMDRLDNYLDYHNIGKIDLLKLDTQGFEPEVLQGAGKRLSDFRVVITELMFYDLYERSLSFTDIEKYLLPAGFRLFDISHISKNPMNGRTDWVDVIYING